MRERGKGGREGEGERGGEERGENGRVRYVTLWVAVS